MSISLRPVQRTDKKILYDWITDRELLILNAPYLPVGEGAHEKWFESIVYGNQNAFFFMIEENKSKKVIGSCQLNNVNWIHRSAELQIRIGESTFHGQGYGSEAVRQLIKFGFSDMNLHRVFLHVFSSNVRAIKAYEKCGFMCEGILKDGAYIDGHFVDVAVMAIIKDVANV